MGKLPAKKETVSISIEGWILDILDKVCEEQDFTRSVFIKRATKEYLLKKLASHDLWSQLYREHIDESQ